MCTQAHAWWKYNLDGQVYYVKADWHDGDCRRDALARFDYILGRLHEQHLTWANRGQMALYSGAAAAAWGFFTAGASLLLTPATVATQLSSYAVAEGFNRANCDLAAHIGVLAATHGMELDDVMNVMPNFRAANVKILDRYTTLGTATPRQPTGTIIPDKSNTRLLIGDQHRVQFTKGTFGTARLPDGPAYGTYTR